MTQNKDQWRVIMNMVMNRHYQLLKEYSTRKHSLYRLTTPVQPIQIKRKNRC